MSSAAMNFLKNNQPRMVSAECKLTMSYLAAHLTAASTIGTLYMFGLFDVGFLSKESLIVTISNYVISIIS